jgi:hypothetical protein
MIGKIKGGIKNKPPLKTRENKKIYQGWGAERVLLPNSSLLIITFRD